MGEVLDCKAVFVSKATNDASSPPVFQAGRMLFDQPIKNIRGGRLRELSRDVVMGQARVGTAERKLANLEGIFSWKK